MFTIKVGVMPGRIKEVILEGGTVADAIKLADLDAQGYSVRYNSQTVSVDTEITNDGTIILVEQVKGNAEVTVKVGVMPGRIKEFIFNEGTTINEAISTAGLNTQGYSVRYNSQQVTNLEQPITTSGTIILAEQVKGN